MRYSHRVHRVHRARRVTQRVFLIAFMLSSMAFAQFPAKQHSGKFLAEDASKSVAPNEVGILGGSDTIWVITAGKYVFALEHNQLLNIFCDLFQKADTNYVTFNYPKLNFYLWLKADT